MCRDFNGEDFEQLYDAEDDVVVVGGVHAAFESVVAADKWRWQLRHSGKLEEVGGKHVVVVAAAAGEGSQFVTDDVAGATDVVAAAVADGADDDAVAAVDDELPLGKA